MWLLVENQPQFGYERQGSSGMSVTKFYTPGEARAAAVARARELGGARPVFVAQVVAEYTAVPTESKVSPIEEVKVT